MTEIALSELQINNFIGSRTELKTRKNAKTRKNTL